MVRRGGGSSPVGMERDPVYIIDAVRTPMGRVNGRLQGLSLATLIAAVIRCPVERSLGGRLEIVGEVVFGNAVSAGAGQNFLRQAVLEAGLPESVPGYVIKNACASGLRAVRSACQAIRCGDVQVAVSGGAENVSQMPELLFKKNHDLKKIKNLTESLMHDGLWCSVSQRRMGSLCEDLVRRRGLLRKDQDDYAFRSYVRARTAQNEGWFAREIAALPMPGGKQCAEDETIRQNVSREVFDSFQGAFEPGGTVTAGNSAAPCDGAAALVLASETARRKYHLKPLARMLGSDSFAGSPQDVFGLQAEAIKIGLQKTGLALSQIDLFEIGEPFAAPVLWARQQLGIPDEKLNISGGDIVLGHPLGAAGTRALVTLLHGLERRNGRYGLVSVCLGGGGVETIIVEREKTG